MSTAAHTLLPPAPARVVGPAAFVAAARGFQAEWHGSDPPGPPPQLVTHPIGADLRAVTTLVAAENGLGAAAVFAVRPEHRLTSRWYGRQAGWEALRAILAAGHEIAIDVDPFALLTRHATVAAGVGAAVDTLAAAGVPPRWLTLHQPPARPGGMSASDFFAELSGDDVAAKDPRFAAHQAACRISELLSLTGALGWLSRGLCTDADGSVVPTISVSDDAGGVEIRCGRPDVSLLTVPTGETESARLAILDTAARVDAVYRLSP